MSTSSKIHIAYGSETGNAKGLAIELHELLTAYQPTLCELNELSITDFTNKDVLLIISSNFGDGEPTGNAVTFYDDLLENVSALTCQFAVFGLGDVSYPRFCGFTIELDEKLCELGAMPIAKRVDADSSYQDFFAQWSQALLDYFAGRPKSLANLELQVKAYGATQSYLASIARVERINQGEFPVYDIDIDIAGSGMNYQAGDLLYIMPAVNQPTFERVLEFYQKNAEPLNETQKQALSQKELRLLGKPIIRAFAKQSKNAELKALTKMSATKQLADYIYGRDIADLLMDYCTPDNLPFDVLLDMLSEVLPRAYSIASCGSTSTDIVRLCVREVAYQLDNKAYIGSGSHFLCHAQVGTKVPVYVRANDHFHLPNEVATPIIMIGAGTGVAPYLGFLSSRFLAHNRSNPSATNKSITNRMDETHLFFGERYRDTDFLYQKEIQAYLDEGKLTAIHCAFSRDQAQKNYVQDVLLSQGALVWRLLEQGAEIYVCGSKANLSKPIDNALTQIAQKYGKLSEDEAKHLVFNLVSEDRYHQDLY